MYIVVGTYAVAAFWKLYSAGDALSTISSSGWVVVCPDIWLSLCVYIGVVQQHVIDHIYLS